MQNPNIDNLALAELIGISSRSIDRMKTKLGVKSRANKSLRTGIRYLKFDITHAMYSVNRKVKGKMKYIGSSSNFEKAVEILDKYLFEIEQGFRA